MGIDFGPEDAFVTWNLVDGIDQIWCNSSGMFMEFFLMLILLIISPSMYHYTLVLLIS